MDGTRVVERLVVLALEVLVVGEGVGDKGVGLPDALEAFAADGVYEAGGDAGTAGFLRIVDEQDLFSSCGEAFC